MKNLIKFQLYDVELGKFAYGTDSVKCESSSGSHEGLLSNVVSISSSKILKRNDQERYEVSAHKDSKAL